METTFWAETLEQLQHSYAAKPKSKLYTLHAYRKNLRTRIHMFYEGNAFLLMDLIPVEEDNPDDEFHHFEDFHNALEYSADVFILFKAT
jgi:hypothetical protein